MLKKLSLLSVYNGLSSCHICAASHPHSQTPPISTTSPSLKRKRHDALLLPTRHNQIPSKCRFYATVRSRSAPDFRDNMNWPCRKNVSPTVIPTPYEIFELEEGAVYSKHKYYELVKLYHPDKNGHLRENQGGVSPGERLERYRLVVLAHEILSDPVKRRAYDSCGAGWGESRSAIRNRARDHYKGGTEHDPSVFGNATWEDWERWYREQGHEPRQQQKHHQQAYAGTYINPNAFASFVILMAVLSGILQATRAGQYSSSLGEKAQAFTEETQQFMTARAQQLSENKFNSDDRIKHFLERRDPSKYGLKDEEEEMYRKHFADSHTHLGPSSSSSSSSSSSQTKKERNYT